MPNQLSERYIISLGGSLIVPDEIDANFLSAFKKVIQAQTQKNKKFLIVPGGGRTGRRYQKALKVTTKTPADNIDWMGIESNRLNAHLLRFVFGAKKHAAVWTYATLPAKLRDSIVVAIGGIKPGGSSDSASVMFAKKIGTKTIINLTNVSGVYDRDPNKFKKAKLISEVSWKKFGQQFGLGRKPGQHKPFDPSVARLAERSGIKVIILSGRDLKNFKAYLEGKKFKGTTIS